MTATIVSPDSISERARLFQALSDETRLAILDLLGSGEQCVCDLQTALDAGQSRLSFHLKVLRDAGLVADRKERRWSFYALVPGRLEAVVDAISAPESLRRTRVPTTPKLHQLTQQRPIADRAPGRPEVDGGCCG